MKFYYYDEFLYSIKKVKSVSPFFYTFTENDVTDIVLLFIFSSWTYFTPFAIVGIKQVNVC